MYNYNEIIRNNYSLLNLITNLSNGNTEKNCSATRDFSKNVKAKMLPISAKFYYIFNLRDLSRVTQGIVQIIPKIANTHELVIAVLAYECYRDFHSKFFTMKNNKFFANKSRKIREGYFKESFDNVLEKSSETLFYAYVADIDCSEYNCVDENKISGLDEKVSNSKFLINDVKNLCKNIIKN
jgi:dynein heavy chain